MSLHDHLYSPCIEHGGQNDFRNNPFRCREFEFVHCIEIKFVFYFLVFFFFGRSDERDGHSCTILLSILINILLFFFENINIQNDLKNDLLHRSILFKKSF